MKSNTVISHEFGKRIADPRSRFHSDYLDYKDGRISRKQLIARLPHAAMIGDSLSRNVYVSSPLGTFLRARRNYGNDWFLNADPGQESILSLFERLDTLTPLVATELGGLGAMVNDGAERENFSRRIIRTRHFAGQVTQLLGHKRFPDMILIWIGHNNVDWAWRCPPEELADPTDRLPRLAKQFRKDYQRQIARLIERARAQKRRVLIMIYGLVDFEAFFKAREVAQSLRKENPRLYPYLGNDYRYLVSMRPEYRVNLVRLLRLLNEELRSMAGEMESAGFPNVRIHYSDALATADVSRVEVIHPIDAWHPSVAGHNLFAEAAFRSIGPHLEFLGIK